MKNVQISQELFMKLLRYHLLDDDSCTEDVKNGLEQKMNTMVERELYTKSKTAPTEEEREQARQEYLDRRGTLLYKWQTRGGCRCEDGSFCKTSGRAP